MNRILDIAALRSFVAVADCGGFQRAAASMHLTQGAVSQHVRKLETAVGRRLIEREGRGSRFNTDGEKLLREARHILALHDQALFDFGVQTDQTLVIGSTEHVAAQLLPDLAATLGDALPNCQIKFRVDRDAELHSGLDEGRVDLALLVGPADDKHAQPVGEFGLTWYSGPGWRPFPAGQPIPLVAFDNPSTIRSRALEILLQHGLAVEVGCETAHVAGMQAALRAGLGVGLMATLRENTEGLVERDDLPASPPVPLSVWSRCHLPTDVSCRAADLVRDMLHDRAVKRPANLRLASGV